MKHIFVNKMMFGIDFGAIYCWHEEMRRRTLIENGLNRLNATLYQNWPQASFLNKIIFILFFRLVLKMNGLKQKVMLTFKILIVQNLLFL
jgi:hypothetical protein